MLHGVSKYVNCCKQGTGKNMKNAVDNFPVKC